MSTGALHTSPASKPLKILLADDHDIVRKGLRYLLEAHPGWQVCAEASNGRQTVALAIEHKPDIVVLDYSMPEMNGLEAARQIRRAVAQAEVLVFTMHDSEDVLREALAAGARGYIVKKDAAERLIEGIEALSQHKAFVSSTVSGVLLDSFLGRSAPEAKPKSQEPLSTREREIVQLLAEGNSNKDIASKLFLSVKTVETHRASIMRKLRVNSIVDVVHYAIRNKMVQP